MYNAELILNKNNFLGESPVWDEKRKVFFWLDIYEKNFHSFDPAKRNCVVTNLSFYTGAFSLTTKQELLFATNQGVKFLNNFKVIKTIDVPGFDPALCNMNDGKCDKSGNFLFGSMDKSESKPVGALYRLNSKHEIETLLSGVVIANGPAFSTNGKTMYFSDSFNRTVLKFNYQSNKNFDDNFEIFLKFDQNEGIPDGLCVDSQDRLYVAMWGGKKINVFNMFGEKVSKVKVPTPNVTSCTFGGTGLNKLYITTATKNLANPDKFAGGLFFTTIDTKGTPADRFSL